MIFLTVQHHLRRGRVPFSDQLPQAIFWIFPVAGLGLFMFVLLYGRERRRTHREFSHIGELKLEGNTGEVQSGTSHNPIEYTGSLLSTVKRIRQVLQENGEAARDNMSNFLRSADGKRFLRVGHRGMRRLCCHNGRLYRKAFLEHLIFSFSMFLCWLLACVAALGSSAYQDFIMRFFFVILCSTCYSVVLLSDSLVQHPTSLLITSTRPLTDDEEFFYLFGGGEIR